MATSLLQGQVRTRPPHKKSQAFSGIQPISKFGTQRFQPLPPPIGEPPYHIDLESIIPGINAKASADGKIVFHTVGDTGGIKHPEYQTDVAKQMKTDLAASGLIPSFFYHLGDVVYYNGERSKYYDQFYEPYDHYSAPIISIPGNHDGDPVPDSDQVSLDGWVDYFMQKVPHIDPVSMDAPRVTLSLPNVYFTLLTPYATMVGMYTTVPEHGSVDSDQQQWLTNELHTAPKDKALIISLHHPVYSFDDHHSGSPKMADVLQHAINESRRVPNLVLTAHVHNYQRIQKEIVEGKPTPFLVAGLGGYYHLHNLTAEAGTVDNNTGAEIIYGDDKNHGYVTLTVDKNSIKGELTLVDKDGDVIKEADTFEYTSEALFLGTNDVVSL